MEATPYQICLYRGNDNYLTIDFMIQRKLWKREQTLPGFYCTTKGGRTEIIHKKSQLCMSDWEKELSEQLALIFRIGCFC